MDSIDNRYVLLEKLGEGGMGAVYRAHDRLTGQHVALKRVSLLAADRVPSPAALAETLAAAESVAGDPRRAATLAAPREDAAPLLLSLALEFRTLASIRHPHIISVLDYGFESSRRPFFTMELLEGARAFSTASAAATNARRVRLLLQVLQALTYVHRRGVLHRDLKPANVLVLGEGEDASVKVLDFGIACVRDQAHRSELAGTIAYMAPELFGGAAPSEAADLWAVGVMAHESLVGVHPLGDLDARGLVAALLQPSPIFTEDTRLGPELSAVLRRALARSPGERYPDAASFGHALALAAGLPPPAETAEIRESFLQAAAFVAREAELSTLRRALDEATAGRGSIWLVGGESGVGKSRLLDELRTLALVRGTRVARGQAVSAGGGAYEVWRGALRPLCLDAALGDLDAGVLRAAVPDVAALVGRSLPDPPELDPQNAQARLLLTIERLLLERRAPQVLVLEDLHWAEPASLAVLQRLARSIARRPLLVVGSYRDDERPDLPDELPGARPLALRRLSPEEMASLCASMLGEVGRRPEVVSLLERETEGNAFFIVEVVRALAHEVGALARIGAGSIPSLVMAGGVRAVLARRLGRVPPGARALLCAAAVLGRELDLEALRALQGDVGARVDADLAACAAASVLEVSDDRWRFAHDKLREAVLAELGEDERALWHHRIGEAVERAHGDDLGPHAAALAYHFDRAGDLARAARYRLLAGEAATHGGAMLEAIAHLERATELFESLGYTPERRAYAFGLLTRAYHGAGRPEECMRIVERMIADAVAPVPSSAAGLFRDIALLAAEHARFRLGPWARPASEDPTRVAWAREVVDSVFAVVEVVPWTRSPAQVLHVALLGAVQAERLGDPQRMAPGYAALGYVLAATPLAWLLDGYLRRARALLARAPGESVEARAFLKMLEGAVHLSRGEWDAGLTCLEEEIEHRRKTGNWRAELLALNQGGSVELFRGSPAAAIERVARLDELARRVDNAQSSCWVRCFHAIFALRRGELARAAQLLVEAEAHNARAHDRLVGLLVGGLSALTALRRGELREARRDADATLERMLATPPMLHGLLEALPAVVEVYATLWIGASSAKERSELHARLEQSLAALRTFGAIVPIARSRALLWHGNHAAMRGRSTLAGWYLRQALASARRYRMPFDEALARQALSGVEAARGAHDRAASLRRDARELFGRLDAGWHLEDLARAAT